MNNDLNNNQTNNNFSQNVMVNESVVPTPINNTPIEPVVEPAPVAPISESTPVEPAVQSVAQSAPAAPVQQVVASQPVINEPQPTVQPVNTPQVPVQPVMQQPTQQETQVPKENILKKLLKNKLVLIIGGAVIALLIIIIIILIVGKSNNEYESLKYIYDPKRPITIEKDNKFGYISTKGKEIVSPTFDSATSFYGGFGVLTIENKSDDLDNSYTIVNEKGKVVKQINGYSAPTYEPVYNIWVLNDGIYNKKFKKITKEDISADYIGCGYSSYTNYGTNEFGIMTNKGKSIFNWTGTSSYATINTDDCGSKDMYAIVTYYDTPERESIVYLNKGKIIYTKEGDNYSFSSIGDGLYKEYNSDDYDYTKYLYFDGGKLLFETEEDISSIEVYDKENNLLLIDYGYNYKKLGKSSEEMIYDAKKKTYTAYDEDTELNNNLEKYYGFKVFESNSKEGLISDNKIILNAEYDNITLLDYNLFKYLKEYHNKSYVLLEKDDKTIVYDVKKSKIVSELNGEAETDESSTFIGGYTYDSSSNKKSGYIVYSLISNKSMTFDYKTTDDLEANTNYITVEHDNVIDYYNTDLEKIYTLES